MENFSKKAGASEGKAFDRIPKQWREKILQNNNKTTPKPYSTKEEGEMVGVCRCWNKQREVLKTERGGSGNPNSTWGNFIPA